jgi:glycosyltransferase involved in cell wall biosynthesis
VDFKSASLRPGIGAFVTRLFSEIVQQAPRHEFVLLGPAAALKGAPRAPWMETRVAEIHAGLGKFRLPLYDQVQMPWALRKERIDVFLCPYYDAPLWMRKPLLVTIHDLVTLRFAEQYRLHSRFYLNSLLRIHARRAIRILTVSEFSKREIVNVLGVPAEKVCVLPSRVPGAFLKDSTSAEIGVSMQRLGIDSEYMLYTGGADPRKNLARLFRAFKRINQEEGRRYKLVLTGDSSQFLRYRSEWEEEGLQNDVVLTGFLTDDELAGLYRRAALVVYPSLWEGFGLPVLEAIACGAPIAASCAASIPEVGGEAAAYFDPRSVDDMVRVIRDALKNAALRARLAVAARLRRAAFQTRRPAEVLLKLLDDVACEVQRKPC